MESWRIKIKKLKFLYAILITSVNIVAQSIVPASFIKSPNSVEYFINSNHAIQSTTNHSRSLSPIIDSVYDWQWNTNSQVWQITGKKINVLYDINNNQTGYIYQNWKGNTWRDSMKTTYSYNANKNLTTETIQNWNGGSWTYSYQINYTYDSNNNKTSYISLNGVNLTPSYKVVWNYNINNNITSKYEQNWSGNAWMDANRNTLSYDANKNLISDKYQALSAGNWVDVYQYSFTYDINNNQTSRTQQSWNGTIWEDAYKATFSYDANKNKTNSLFQSWNGSSWENSSQYTYTYNINNNKTNEISLSWNGGTLTNYHTQSWTYDANYLLKNETYKNWNTAMTKVLDGDSSAYYYQAVVGINQLKTSVENVTLFPNPSNGKFTVNSNFPIYAIAIYNIVGERIASDFLFNQQTNNEINLSNYGKGIYFIKIESETAIKTHKIVIQ